MANPATLKAALDAIDAIAISAPMSSSDYNQAVSDAHYAFGQTYVVAVTSVSGVTPGGGISGPGAGTIS